MGRKVPLSPDAVAGQSPERTSTITISKSALYARQTGQATYDSARAARDSIIANRPTYLPFIDHSLNFADLLIL